MEFKDLAQTKFEIKHSGSNKTYDSGMTREDKADKIDYTLAMDGPMFRRLAVHLTKGAKLHGKRNWMLANGEKELEDFRVGAVRHMIQWLNGEEDEDHAAACYFNICGYEYVKEKMKNGQKIGR